MKASASSPKVLLGVTGGIAAYKAPEIVRALVEAACEVRVVLTQRAVEFVTPTTLATLSGHPVLRTEFGEENSHEIGHIEMARWADALVVAPATANSIARFACGRADDLLSTIYLTFDGPAVVAPAMNPRMWERRETQANVEALGERGVAIVPPEEGFLACGDRGQGRMAAIEKIVFETVAAARRTSSLEGRTVLVTAGPTHERLDPVRFLSNRSTGRMGYALAAAARSRGARVILISGPTSLHPPWNVEIQRVESACEMNEAVLAHAAEADVVVMTAAVSDHRPKTVSKVKLNRRDEMPTLELEANPDILLEISRRRRRARQVIVGFAAETGDEVAKGVAKRERKGCDLLVANDVNAAGAGFAVETNIVTVIGRNGEHEAWPQLPKRAVAERLMDRIESELAIATDACRSDSVC